MYAINNENLNKMIIDNILVHEHIKKKELLSIINTQYPELDDRNLRKHVEHIKQMYINGETGMMIVASKLGYSMTDDVALIEKSARYDLKRGLSMVVKAHNILNRLGLNVNDELFEILGGDKGDNGNR